SRLDPLRRKGRVAADNLAGRQPISQVGQDDSNWDARPADARFPVNDQGIHRNVILPVHWSLPLKISLLGRVAARARRSRRRASAYVPVFAPRGDRLSRARARARSSGASLVRPVPRASKRDRASSRAQPPPAGTRRPLLSKPLAIARVLGSW